jgi:hypothetical protein
MQEQEEAAAHRATLLLATRAAARDRCDAPLAAQLQGGNAFKISDNHGQPEQRVAGLAPPRAAAITTEGSAPSSTGRTSL